MLSKKDAKRPHIVVIGGGTGTFVAAEPGIAQDQAKRLEFLGKFCNEWIAEAGKFGFTLPELVAALNDRLTERR